MDNHHNIRLNSNVSVVLADNTKFEGILINELPDSLIIKLDNGYNIGVKKEEVYSIKLIEPSENANSFKSLFDKHLESYKKEDDREDFEGCRKTKKATISLIHTGGTIASRVDYETGAVVAKFGPEDILEMFPELEDIADIHSVVIGNFLSENMRIEHYNLIAEKVKEELDRSDGVIITHGTDTMHYTSSALSFILENLNKPVVLVGAQRSSDRASSDAYLNLVNAAFFISEKKLPGVFVCMHDSINDDYSVVIEGVKARKMHTSRRDAFKSINTKPVAVVDYNNRKIKMLKKFEVEIGSNPLILKKMNPKLKVGLLKSYPGITHEIFDSFIGYDGLVVEGTGLGHLPIVESDELTAENKRIYESLKDLANQTLIVMSSQTIYGRINMNVYSPGRKLLEVGVLGNLSDMTPETAFIKLWWLLSNFSREEIIEKNLVLKNFRGEISNRSDESFNLPE